MTASVSWDGKGRFLRALDQAGDELTQLAGVPAEQGAIALAAARPLTPRLTGRLAASLTYLVSGSTVELRSPLVYAAPVHRRRPFLTDGAERSSDKLTAVVQRKIDLALTHIEGRY